MDTFSHVIFILLITVLLALNCSDQTSIPRPEHPRPDFYRQDWKNLNGIWEFDFDPNNIGESQVWFKKGTHTFSGTITVPYPWESKLSGVADTRYKGAAWYQRTFRIPSKWNGHRVFLKFGAIDYYGKVWINGRYVGKHEGGYTPFEFDITEHIDFSGHNTLVVRVYDSTERWQPTGKQINWYTRTSGIWQTVYLEASHSKTRIDQIQISPDIDQEKVTFKIIVGRASSTRDLEVIVGFKNGEYTSEGKTMSSTGRAEMDIAMPGAKLWAPEDPYLYDIVVTLKDGSDIIDNVSTYFGMRKISTSKWADNEFEYIQLNNKPYYLIGALNQAFNPEGVYTYPSDGYARRDIEKTKAFGFNFLRIHIKVDEPRFLYWADRLGVLLMCDMPNFWSDSTLARAAYTKMLKAAVTRDFNHPSIFSWCLFNETWGIGFRNNYTPELQKWVRSQYHLAKELDPTRLIEDNSPCHYDHVQTDINSWHFYINDYERARSHVNRVVDNTYPGSDFNYIGANRQSTAPLINSEYGGISAGSGDQDISWCFKYLTNELRKHAKIGGYIYTELQDIEWEHNGFMDYDRLDKDFGYHDVCSDFSCRDLNNADFVVIDAPPGSQLSPEEIFNSDLYLSHFSNDKYITGQLCWKLDGWNTFAEKKEIYRDAMPAALEPFKVNKAGTISFPMPSEPLLATLKVWFQDGSGKVWASNYINLSSVPAQVPITTMHSNGDTWIRFNPEDYTLKSWRDSTWRSEDVGMKSIGYGAGKFDYMLPWPESISTDNVKTLELHFEAAAKAPISAKVDARFPDVHWSGKKPDRDYPQTDSSKWPSELTLSLNDIEIKTIQLPDDPADARGVLSHMLGVHPGSYGYLHRIVLEGATLQKVLSTIDQKIKLTFEVKKSTDEMGGLTLFGHRLGAYPLPPSLVVKKLR